MESTWDILAVISYSNCSQKSASRKLLRATLFSSLVNFFVVGVADRDLTVDSLIGFSFGSLAVFGFEVGFVLLLLVIVSSLYSLASLPRLLLRH